jgi:hypothetical protein
MNRSAADDFRSLTHEPTPRCQRDKGSDGLGPGSIVRCRNRDWVLLPSDIPDVHPLRPLTGVTDEVVAVHRHLTDLISFELPEERVRSATFPLPSPPSNRLPLSASTAGATSPTRSSPSSPMRALKHVFQNHCQRLPGKTSPPALRETPGNSFRLGLMKSS